MNVLPQLYSPLFISLTFKPFNNSTTKTLKILTVNLQTPPTSKSIRETTHSNNPTLHDNHGYQRISDGITFHFNFETVKQGVVSTNHI